MKTFLKLILILFFNFTINLNNLNAQQLEEVENENGSISKYIFCDVCPNSEGGYGDWVHVSTEGGEVDENEGENGSNYNDEDWGLDQDDIWDSDFSLEDLLEMLDIYDDIEGNNSGFPGLCPKLISLTKKPLPNVVRKKIGIGEEIMVLIENNCGFSNAWSISGPGKIISSSTFGCSFKANWTPGKVKLSVKMSGIVGCEGCQTDLDIEFEVIAPNGVHFDNFTLQKSDPCYQKFGHTFNRPSASFFSDNYLKPDDVNFYNVEVAESSAIPTVIGPYFQNSLITMPMHNTTGFIKCFDRVIPGKGTLVKFDDIILAFVCAKLRDPKLQGEVQYLIGQYYWDEISKKPVLIENVLQSAENNGGDPNPFFNLVKKTALAFNKLLDPSQCDDGVICD